MGGFGRSGTLTFLFTDIESSTALWDRFPDAMAKALVRHDEILRGAIAEAGGSVFSEGGDGFGAVFDRAEDALRAAAAVQRALTAERWPTPVPIRVRMGLHSGTSEARDGNYFGTTVNRAARVSARAGGGEVLLSSATAALVADGAWALTDEGLHDLKGLDRPERLHRLWIDEQQPTPSPRSVRGNLPRAVGSLVGRADELARLGPQLREGAMVTLRGPGGVGKTRLAVALADVARHQFLDGAWFVDLAGVTSERHVPAAFITALDLYVPIAEPDATDVARALGADRRVIVVDNCEHVLSAAAAAIDAINDRCPNIAVLATSREPLGCAAERVVAVVPLATAAAVGSSPAAELLLERVATRVPEFAPTDRDREAIEEICARLDGLPLAIELAAARVGALGVEQVRRQLATSTDLTDQRRRGADRQRSLRDSVRWSYELLGDDERTVFDRLAVFPHTFDFDAAAAICVDADERIDVSDVMTRLVEKSMVTVAILDGRMRYRLLAMPREFGRDRLAERTELERWQRRHAAHYLAWCAKADEGVRGAEEEAWHLSFVHEWDNVRAVYGFFADRAMADELCELVWHVQWWAQTRAFMEVGDWAELTLQVAGADRHPAYAIVMAVGASFARLREQPDQAAVRVAEALEHERLHGAAPAPWPVFERIRQERSIQGVARPSDFDDIRSRDDSPFWEVLLDYPLMQTEVLERTWSTEPDPRHDLRRRVEDAVRRAERLGMPTLLARAYGLRANLMRGTEPVAALELCERVARMAGAVGSHAIVREQMIDILQLTAVTGAPLDAVRQAVERMRAYRRAAAMNLAASMALATFPALVMLHEYDAAATFAHVMRRSSPAVWVEFLTPAYLVAQLEEEWGPITAARWSFGRDEFYEWFYATLEDVLERHTLRPGGANSSVGAR